MMLKPDAIEKKLIGEIIKRIEDAGLTIAAAKLVKLSLEQAESLYQEHEGKEFYQGLLDFALSGPVLLTVVKGKNAIKKVRELVGATNPKEAAPGTIRGDFAKEQELPKNMVHASDSSENAQREISLFFTEDKIY